MHPTYREEGSDARLSTQSLALSFSSALLMALAVPNELMRYGIPLLGFVSLIPLYVAIAGLASPKSAAVATGLFGSLQHAMTSFWLWFFKDFRFWTLGTTTIAYFVVYSVLGFYLWLAIARGGRARPVLFALLWVAFEYQKSVGFLGYPWGLIPYSLTTVTPFLQIADITGIYGISFFLAMANAALAETCIGAWMGSESVPPRFLAAPRTGSATILPNPLRLAYLFLSLILVLAALGYGLWRMSASIPVKGSFNAVLVQTNADPWLDEEEKALGLTVRLAREAVESSPEPVDVVLFSETLLRRPYQEFRSYYGRHPTADPLVPFIKDSGAWLLTGAPIILDWQSYEGTNSAILIDPQARLVDSYAKTHPVPFAEAIPFWEFAFFRNFIQNVVGLASGWVMGSEYKVMRFKVGDHEFAFGSPICFEDAFPDVCRRFYQQDADLLINLTNIAWSRTVSAEVQHWASARFRAIESRRTLVRSTNGGVSCVVDPYGRNIASMPLFESKAMFVKVPVYDPPARTPYIVFGDWFAASALLLFAVTAIILMLRELSTVGSSRGLRGG